MPGLPRTRLARLLERRNAQDAKRAGDTLVLAAVALLVLVSLRAWAGVALVLVALCAIVGRLAWRVARRNSVLAALDGGDGVVVVGGGGEHDHKVTEHSAAHEADR